MDYLNEETTRYKKKSQAKPPKKTKHKHIFEPCIIESPVDWHKKPHERSGEKQSEFGGFCPICGKVGPTDQSRWWTNASKCIKGFRFADCVPTKEGARELNPETRTLRTFWSEDIFAKFVDIEETD